MKLTELLEYKLFKNDSGYKIYMNPSANDIRHLLKNSYLLNLPDESDSEISFLKRYGRNIHGLNFPLRGVVIDDNVYIVDSYDADHNDLANTLHRQGIESDRRILIVIERHPKASPDDLENYVIGALLPDINDLKNMATIIRMKLPIKKWGLW